MFDFDTGKLVVIGIVALVVIGPKELPRVLRQVGQTVGKVRRMAGEFQSQFMEAMREAELSDVKQEMGKIADAAKIDVAFDPVRDIRNQISGAIAGEVSPGPSISALPDGLLGKSVDLSALENAASPVADVALGEGGLVGGGIAPATPATSHSSDGRPSVEEASDDGAGIVAAAVAPQPAAEIEAPMRDDRPDAQTAARVA